MFNPLASVGSLWLVSGPPAVKASINPPTNFTVSTGASFATLSFTAPVGATSYTVTATPITNTHEIVVSRTFTSGTGYKLEVLSSQTAYTFSLVARNSSGGVSSAVSTSATTMAATVQAVPTITLSSAISTYNVQAGDYTSYNHIASAKTNPNIVYAGFFYTSSTYLSYQRVFYSQDGCVTGDFTLGSRLARVGAGPYPDGPDYGTSDVACSDDGKYVYVLPKYLNTSSNYGSTFTSSLLTANFTTNIGLSLNPTGEIVMVAGTGSSGYGTTSTVVQ